MSRFKIKIILFMIYFLPVQSLAGPAPVPYQPSELDLKQKEGTPRELPSENTGQPEISHDHTQDTLNLTTPDPMKRSKSFFYQYTKALSIFFGAYDLYQPPQEYTLYGHYGFSYLLPSPRDTHWELGLEGTSFGEGRAWGTLRQIYGGTEARRPYISGGLGVKILPQNALGGLLKIDNFFLRGAAGIEQSLFGASSLRAEFSIAPDAKGQVFVGVDLGYSLGF